MLFRSEAVHARRDKALGSVLLVSPVPLRWAALAALLFSVLLIVFLTCASYTRRATVTGVLVPQGGLIKVFAPQAGVVQGLAAVEGQTVEAGATLMALGSDLYAEAGGAQVAISRLIKRRNDSLTEEIATTRALHLQELEGKRRRLAVLDSEQHKVVTQMDISRQRLGLAQGIAARYADLQRQDYVSRDQLQEKQDAVLEVRLRSEELSRSLLSLRNDIATLRAELAELPFNQGKQLAELERRLSQSQGSLLESEVKRQVVITAPASGEVTAIGVVNGTRADSNRPLLSIVPKDAQLYAELYVPSRSVGFVRPGDAVLLRYQAYPYQHFGLARGTVASVSRSALPADEIMTVGGVSEQQREQGPLYRVRVTLEQQSMLGRGLNERLRSGMQLDADILQENMPLYEWLLEPLRGIGKRL
ncbi:HlyD family secretion protein [Pseudomonas sp. SBB6]|uniref:HlyD family secretion protein n=1 Tax=Pseudomonas sp. SBB6 TaxID=2962032 RepID=UPI0020B75531|nr:HlyD family efflux transporter periplasmic adaptor subunit [Pseudomonas sp. SBB6]MCP3748821.1 HlyD family efflux transporter periplasmic adaptor subunit [Pseudomonas sp. SBB6]